MVAFILQAGRSPQSGSISPVDIHVAAQGLSGPELSPAEGARVRPGRPYAPSQETRRVFCESLLLPRRAMERCGRLIPRNPKVSPAPRPVPGTFHGLLHRPPAISPPPQQQPIWEFVTDGRKNVDADRRSIYVLVEKQRLPQQTAAHKSTGPNEEIFFLPILLQRQNREREGLTIGAL